VLCTLVEVLCPQVEAFVVQNELNVDTKVIAYLANQTMVGVLPQPHPIITHSFIHTPALKAWVTAYLWVLHLTYLRVHFILHLLTYPMLKLLNFVLQHMEEQRFDSLELHLRMKSKSLFYFFFPRDARIPLTVV
jgi:hypothetical protein